MKEIRVILSGLLFPPYQNIIASNVIIFKNNWFHFFFFNMVQLNQDVPGHLTGW